VLAVENAAIDGCAQAAAVALSVSFGGALSGGGAKTTSTVETTTKAYIVSSTVTLGGDLTVTAASTTTARAEVMTTSAAAGLVGIAAAGSIAIVTVKPIVEASVTGSTVDAGNVSVTATATPHGSAAAMGNAVSTGASVGVSQADTEVSPTVTALVGGALTADSVSVVARQLLPGGGLDTAWARAQGSAGGLLVGVNAGTSTASANAVVTSAIVGGANLDVAGAVAVTASLSQRAKVQGEGLAIGGLVAVGVIDATAEVNGQTSAYVGTDASLDVGSLLVQATADETAIADSVASAGGLVADGDNEASAFVTSDVSAYLAGGVSVTSTGDVLIEAKGSPEADAQTSGIVVGVGVAVGGSRSDVTIDSAVAASVGAGSVVQAGGSVTVSSSTREDALSYGDGISFAWSDGSVGGFVGVQGNRALATGSVTTRTTIGANTRISADGALAVLAATDIAGLSAQTTGGTGGLVAVGGQQAEVNVTALEATVDVAGAQLTAGGAVTIRSDTAATLAANGDQSAKAAVAIAEVKANIMAVQTATVSISDAEIAGASIDITALVSRAGANAYAYCDSGGVGAAPDARADVDLDIDAKATGYSVKLDAPHVEVTAANRGLDTYAHSNAIAKAAGIDIYTTAYNDVNKTAKIDLTGLIVTRDLWFTADTLGDTGAFADADWDYGTWSSGKLTYGEHTILNRRSQILTTLTVTCGVEHSLDLKVYPNGNVRSDGIPYHVDPVTDNIVVDSFRYDSPVPPQPRPHFLSTGLTRSITGSRAMPGSSITAPTQPISSTSRPEPWIWAPFTDRRQTIPPGMSGSSAPTRRTLMLPTIRPRPGQTCSKCGPSAISAWAGPSICPSVAPR
jgi:hypothetical protein